MLKDKSKRRKRFLLVGHKVSRSHDNGFESRKEQKLPSGPEQKGRHRPHTSAPAPGSSKVPILLTGTCWVTGRGLGGLAVTAAGPRGREGPLTRGCECGRRFNLMQQVETCTQP